MSEETEEVPFVNSTEGDSLLSRHSQVAETAVDVQRIQGVLKILEQSKNLEAPGRRPIPLEPRLSWGFTLSFPSCQEKNLSFRKGDARWVLTLKVAEAPGVQRAWNMESTKSGR